MLRNPTPQARRAATLGGMRRSLVAACVAVILLVTGCSATEPDSFTESAVSEDVTEATITLEDVWADIPCDGSTRGIQQGDDSDYIQRAGVCKLAADLGSVYFFEFASVGSLNTGVVLDLEVGAGDTLFADQNVAILATDDESARMLAQKYEEIE